MNPVRRTPWECVSGLACSLLIACAPNVAAAGSANPAPSERPHPDQLPNTNDSKFALPAITFPDPSGQQQGGAEKANLLRQVVFQGNRILSNDELDLVIAPWLGRTVSEADLEIMRLELTRYYISRGFINSGARLTALRPDQQGIFRIEIVEGRLNVLRISGAADLDERYIVQRLWPQADAPLNVNILRENFQRLMDDPLFVSINARLGPGDAPGEAVLELDMVRARSYQFDIHANNYRPASIGEGAWGVNGQLSNLTGHGDLLELHAQKPFKGDDIVSGGVSWRMPLNYSGTELTLRADNGESVVIEPPLRPLNIRSVQRSREIGLGHAWLDRPSQRFVTGISLLGRESRTSLAGQPFSFVSGDSDGEVKAHTFKFWQEYTDRSEERVFALRSSFSATRHNQQVSGNAGQATRSAAAYWMWLGQIHFGKKISDQGTQLIGRAVVQASPRAVLSMDGLAIGGVATVRGFRENMMIRDKGFVVNLEVEIPVWPTQSSATSNLNLTPFLDYGKGHSHQADADSIMSAGVALRWIVDSLAVDVAAARRLKARQGLSPDDHSLQGAGVHLQIRYRF